MPVKTRPSEQSAAEPTELEERESALLLTYERGDFEQ